jgi:hypothetical protein
MPRQNLCTPKRRKFALRRSGLLASLAPPLHDPYRQQQRWIQQHLIVGWPIALLACACVALSSLPARAEQSCAPKTNAAKILRTKNVNDVDPNWAPPAFIGTSWSLIETRQEGEFLSGVLVNPRGGVLPGRVYVIANEWDCG